MSNNNTYNPIQDYPRIRLPGWVDEISPEYKRLRIAITRKYGWISFFSSTFILLCMAIVNYVYKTHYYAISKRLKKFYHSHSPVYGFIVNSRISQIVAFWSVYSLLILTPELNYDLMFLTKRLGRLAVTLMPLLLFLTIRPSPMPKNLYLSLLPVHKWVSRIVVCQSLLHSIFYTASYFHKQTLSKIWKKRQILGWIPMAAFLMIAITSLSPIRRKYFKFFYINHYLLTWVSVICLFFHSKPPANLATFLNVAVLIYQIYLRFTNTSLVKLQIIPLSPNLKVIEIAKSSIPEGRFEFKHSIMPCSHLRMQKRYTNPLINWWYRFISPLAHPYTIASLPSDNSIVLVVRNTKFDLNNIDEYYITGTYDPDLEFVEFTEKRDDFISRPVNSHHSFSRWFKDSPIKKSLLKNSNIVTLTSYYKVSASRMLMIIGGSGISVALPLLRILSIQGIPSKIIWVIKDIQDLRLFKHFKNIDVNAIEIYLTSKTYKFEHLRENILRLDELLFDKLDDHENNASVLPMISINGVKDSDYDTREVDFTNFGATMPPVEENDLGDKHNYFTVPIIRKTRRSKSLSSVDTPPCYDDLFKRKRLSGKKSIKDLITDRLNLDTFRKDHQENADDDDDIQGSNADNVGINISKYSNNYDTKIKQERVLNKSKSISGNLLTSDLDTISNYGSINHDDHEPLLPRTSSKIWKTNEEFKLPIIIKADRASNGQYASIVKQLKIYRGRPVLGQNEFNWCLNHFCTGTSENSSINTDFNAIEEEETSDLLHPPGGSSHYHQKRHVDRSPSNGSHAVVECCKDMGSVDLDEILEKVWVVGVGPEGLTKKAKLWARENRLNFHDESFSV
ncbi:putative ferric-chelate reductase [Saccharomycopsis crataegensis]|uniref:Ferric-chelate reductase n=1 Tax=Saccharomycopsis crataegensis TaxID=43959 RepID=A0AAV5QG95_9ASCO|nr:putative ferric-chelate reductase [Saccharomycopsis crataegensis]